MSDTLQAHTEAKITPEKIAILQARVGQERPAPYDEEPPFNALASTDTIRHYAFSNGDDNPLFCNPAYAASSRWEGVIAPPMYHTTMGMSDLRMQPGQSLRRLRDPLRGVHAFVSGTEVEFWQPVRPGDQVFTRSALHSVTEKRSDFGGGVAVHQIRRTVMRNQRREPVCAAYALMINTERGGAASAGKYKEIKRPYYTKEMIEAIDAIYEAHYRRGAEPRYWEDVEVGDEMPQMVKGPLQMVDVIGSHVSRGQGGYGEGPLRMGYLNRKRLPGFYVPNSWGLPEVVQRCHWDDEWAQAVGAAYAYDYGIMRENWLAEYACNWMGDDAWIWKFSSQIRRFNFIGDTQYFFGKVIRKFETDAGTPAVDLEFWGQNQNGDVTCPGGATVLLPSRAKGLPLLPLPPQDIRELANKGTQIVDAAEYEHQV